MAIESLANLAVKVSDLDSAIDFYVRSGAEVRDRMTWGGGERADVFFGPVMITLFTKAIYEDSRPVAEGFLHPALFTDDLDAQLAGHKIVWGPAEVEGAFGRRRIAFVEAPGNMRLEFMEQLAPAGAGAASPTPTPSAKLAGRTAGRGGDGDGDGTAYARELARRLHEGQVDKSGAPYFGHVDRVAETVRRSGGEPSQVSAGYLHDTIEDTGATVESLVAAGISPEVVILVEALTHYPNEPRANYYERVRRVPAAVLVKLCDIHDNLGPNRLSGLPPDTQRRLMRKYGEALIAISAPSAGGAVESGAVESGAGPGGAVESGAGPGGAVESGAGPGGAVESGADPGGAVESGAGPGGAVESGAGPGGAVESATKAGG